uniref:Uncharacterized protein n=1 Tax=Ditylenchus dipsaci TaxID=166011 RepID=A0A915EC46_9BILA
MPKVDFLRSIAINLGRIPVSKQPIISKRENAAACEKYGKKPKYETEVVTVDDTPAFLIGYLMGYSNRPVPAADEPVLEDVLPANLAF